MAADTPDAPGGPEDPRVDAALRWRLVLGRHGDDALPLEGESGEGDPGSEGGGDLADRVLEAPQLDQALEYIYDREFARRSHRQAGSGEGRADSRCPRGCTGCDRCSRATPPR